MDRYPPSEAHGLTGDLQTAALVTDDARIDWFCAPRFDPPSVGEVIDFMPVAGSAATDRYLLVRMVRSRSLTVNLSHAPHRRERVEFRHIHQEGGGVVLETAPDGPPRALAQDKVKRMFTDTREYRRRWLARSRYTGRWREVVERSALLGLGFTEEARAFITWLGERVRDVEDGAAPLQVMDRVDGSPDLAEETLDHWEGYRGSSPVRIGNGAADQVQLDIYGEALDSVYPSDSHAVELSHKGCERVSSVVDWLCDHWDEAEDGIWETRSGRLNDARLTFEKMHTYANHLGLYSEEIGPTGEQLGNYPQAFSHLALISAAVNLDDQLDHGAGWVAPVLRRAARGGGDTVSAGGA